ncbi:MAG: archaemetzincin family Zn-dependent metalloprotease [Anaerolineae bacterium]|nr:archaemetzincin family Zn-dependent metalloprotease [Anaerolineae bacterium]MDW8101885.1 archaemetzincin family Zn-dependent metalloprotease [Anaerolineae bacterium]
MTIALVPFGQVELKVLEHLKEALKKTFGKECEILPSIPTPAEAFNPSRRQYFSDFFLEYLSKLEVKKAIKVLGITEVDLYTRGLNFVFGQARLGGREAVISLARLRQSFYGLPEDEQLLLERALKEAVHELGHTWGLTHCPDPLCVMHFSNSLRDTDVKKAEFCPRCLLILKARL